MTLLYHTESVCKVIFKKLSFVKLATL